MDPKSNEMVLMKKTEKDNTDTHREESHVKTEAETGMMCLQAKEHQGSLTTRSFLRKLGERYGIFSPSEPPGESTLLTL